MPVNNEVLVRGIRRSPDSEKIFVENYAKAGETFAISLAAKTGFSGNVNIPHHFNRQGCIVYSPGDAESAQEDFGSTVYQPILHSIGFASKVKLTAVSGSFSNVPFIIPANFMIAFDMAIRYIKHQNNGAGETPELRIGFVLKV